MNCAPENVMNKAFVNELYKLVEDRFHVTIVNHRGRYLRYLTLAESYEFFEPY